MDFSLRHVSAGLFVSLLTLLIVTGCGQSNEVKLAKALQMVSTQTDPSSVINKAPSTSHSQSGLRAAGGEVRGIRNAEDQSPKKYETAKYICGEDTYEFTDMTMGYATMERRFDTGDREADVTYDIVASAKGGDFGDEPVSISCKSILTFNYSEKTDTQIRETTPSLQSCDQFDCKVDGESVDCEEVKKALQDEENRCQIPNRI